MSILDYILKNNEKVPFYKAIVGIPFEEIAQYINDTSRTSHSKEKLLKRINGENAEEYELNMGRNAGYLFEFIQQGEITNTDIDTYLEEYADENCIKANSKNTLRKYFFLQLLNSRLEDIANNESIITQNREHIIYAICNLTVEFISEKYELINRLIRKLDDGEYSNHFRTALCYIDQVLYKQPAVEITLEEAVITK